MSRPRKRLPSKYFYDETGSELFERIQKASPSPYEFFLQFGDEQLIGASPDEAHASNGLEKEKGWDETIHQGAGSSGAGNARGRGNTSG